MFPRRSGGSVFHVSTSSSRPSPERLSRDWWAHGLTLAERLAVADRPVDGRVNGEREQSARRRLERWRAGHGLGTSEGFAHRMAHAGLDDAGLMALLAESRKSLGARASRPAWAGLVERAVASAPETSTPVAVGSEDSFRLSLAAFSVSLGAFIEDAVDRVRCGAPTADVDIAAVCAGFADQLARRVVRLASRTLVLELNAARVTGQLRGETAQERFADFAGQLATGSGLASLVEEYPVLARLIGQMCELAADSMLELLDRFAADRDAVVATLLHGVDPGPLVAVDMGGGDRHQRGRSVAMLRFAGGEIVVYKPRSQQMQEYFGELVEWLNGKAPGLDLRVPAVLSRPGYGWVEFVAHRPCVDVAEVDRFYHRQGALLALLYAVDGTDIHYENLIAAGDQPILVDVETLFHPSIAPAAATPDPAAMALTSSVVRTALLPQLLLGDNGAMDISGLGGDKNATYPFDVVGFDSAGTDEMRLVRGPRQVHGADNRPRLGDADADADPSAYQSALLVGFRTVYDVIVAHRSELVGQDGLLSGCADLEVRIIVRPTQTYATLLDESTHPNVLRDGLDRDSVFDLLWADAAHDRVLGRLAPMEIADMWAGDVPMFVGRPTSRDVWTATGDRVPDVLEQSSLDAVTAKIMAMCELDRLDQEWLITAAFAARGQTVDHRSGNALPGQITASVPDSQRLLATACGIADELIARARHDDSRANWLGIEPIDGQHWTVTPMGAALADGYPGVALFLAQLGKLTGSARYISLARKAIDPIPRLLDVLAGDLDIARAIGPGGFLGLGGICYALSRLATLLGDSDIRSWLGLAVELTGAAEGPQTGLVAGRGGGLVAMLAVHAETGLPAAGKLATTFADSLLRPDDVPADEVVPPSGFAAGPAGVGYGLLRLAATGAGEKYAAAGNAAIERTESLDAMLAARNYSWCTGLSGAVLARADLPDGQRENQLDRYVTALADHRPLQDTSLCHGELGTVEPLTVLATRGHEHAASVRMHSTARILGALDRYGPRCGTPDGVLSPGLLTGLAGIGYGLLRLGFAKDVPSVLLLEPTSSKP